jgi:hypothetical protein
MFSACQKADGNCYLNEKGVLMVEFMQQRTTIMSEVYYETLLKKLHWAAYSHSHLSTGSRLTTLHTAVISF